MQFYIHANCFHLFEFKTGSKLLTRASGDFSSTKNFRELKIIRIFTVKTFAISYFKIFQGISFAKMTKNRKNC